MIEAFLSAAGAFGSAGRRAERKGACLMAARAVANRSEPMTVTTPRGPVEVVRQQWRSQRAGSRWEWEWLARRGGQRDWKQGSTAREAIRQATLLSPGKQPGWLIAAVEEAERGLSAQPAEAPADPPASGHSLPWEGSGDIDSVAIAPTVDWVRETKTRTYDGRHLARVCEQAAWLSRRRRSWARNGALGAVCVVRARGVERVERGVLVVSVER
jgi:hypothetical protein